MRDELLPPRHGVLDPKGDLKEGVIPGGDGWVNQSNRGEFNPTPNPNRFIKSRRTYSPNCNHRR